MTLLSRERLKALKQLHENGDKAKLSSLLLEGAMIEWERHLRSKEVEKLAVARWRRRVVRLRRQRKKAEQLDAHTQFIQQVITLIREKQLNPTAAFMKSVKDPELKRKLVEATCLSKV